MKNGSTKRKMWLIVGAAVLVTVGAIIAGVAVWKETAHRLASKEPGEEPVEEDPEFMFCQGDPEYLDNYDDIGVMIMDCDDESSFKTLQNAAITHRKGHYVQGTGALKTSNLLNTAVTKGTFADVDISGYADGSVHMSLYVSDPVYLGERPVYLELSSSGTYDVDELSWVIPSSVLEPGWNELYLGMEDASVAGEPDLTKINYYRLFTTGGLVGLEVSMDAVYATDSKGMSLEAKASDKTASTKEGYLMDCDTLEAVTSSGTLSLSTAAGELKEGSGAIIVSDPTLVWMMANLKQTDISDCEGGKLSFWVYINDVSYVKSGSICVEITSSGTYDVNEMSWVIKGSDLKSGWNEVSLNMASAVHTKEKIDLKKVNFLRIFGLDCQEDLIVILDGIRAIPPAKRIAEDGLILSCDTVDNMKTRSSNTFTVTTVAGEYKEGTGAFKTAGAGQVWWQVWLDELVDVSAYADGGIHLWLYVSDPAKLKTQVGIELGSGGNPDTDEYQWNVSGLKAGWNELKLGFTDATVSGTPDLHKLNHFRVYAECSGEITAMLDDVRAIQIEKKILAPGMIFDCDSTSGMSASSGGKFTVTSEEGEYQEGTGAFLYEGSKAEWWKVVLKEPVDVSDYAEGGVHIWLYISDTANLKNNLYIELGSGGKADVNEHQWAVTGTSLKSGEWNELYLSFEDAVKSKDGGADLSKINWFRVFGECTGEITAIVDDVRAIRAPEDPEAPGSSGTILSCDTTEGLSVNSGLKVTSTEGEYQEGTGAFLYEGSKAEWWKVVIKKPADVSDYAEGGVHLWLYISDTANLKNNLYIELGSGGKADVNEHQWTVTGTSLKSGEWNELYLSFEDAVKSKDGGADLSKINWFRVFGECTGEITAIVDDVRAIQAPEEEEPDEPEDPGKTILNCDTTEGLSVNSSLKVTEAEGEYQEGTGAFLFKGSKTEWWKVVIKEPVYISDYAEDGIHLWLYISDTANLKNNLYIELGSGGKADVNEHQWTVTGTSLKSGEWNELYLSFEDAVKSKDGGADLSKINWFRVFGECTGEITAIVDDVRAVQAPEKEDPTEAESLGMISTYTAVSWKQNWGSAQRVGWLLAYNLKRINQQYRDRVGWLLAYNLKNRSTI